MAKNFQQRVMENEEAISALKKQVFELAKRCGNLELKYGQPVGKSGNTMPPTKRPEVLIELELGKDPEGAVSGRRYPG